MTEMIENADCEKDRVMFMLEFSQNKVVHAVLCLSIVRNPHFLSRTCDV